ncbi:MAG: HAD family hydrolase [Thermomicrobiales bacterium]
MISGVLFDLDNTLIDRDIAFENWAHYFATVQLQLIEDELAKVEVEWLTALDAGGYGPKPAMFAAIHKRYPNHIADPQSLAESFTAELRDHLPPLDEPTIALLKDLETAGIPWGIVTNGSPTQLKKLERVGLDGAKCVVVSGILGIRKPEPGIFLAAAEGLGLEPGNILFVGDNVEADIIGAANVGMTTAWMHRGRSWPVNEAGIEPYLVIEHVAEIRGMLAVPRAAPPGCA